MRLRTFAILAGLVAAGVAAAEYVNGHTFAVGVMPACDARATVNLLTDALAESPAHLRVDAVREIETLTAPGEEPRRCRVTAFTSAGKRTLTFHLEWMSASKSEIWLQVDG